MQIRIMMGRDLKIRAVVNPLAPEPTDPPGSSIIAANPILTVILIFQKYVFFFSDLFIQLLSFEYFIYIFIASDHILNVHLN